MKLFLNGAESTLSDQMADDLARAVINSIFSWRRASDDDDLPGRTKEGWWGDSYADEVGDQFGSTLWLLQRSKLTSETLLRAKEYVEESLQWLIDDRVADSFKVYVERDGADRMNILVTIYKPDQTKLDIRFQDVWER